MHTSIVPCACDTLSCAAFQGAFILGRSCRTTTRCNVCAIGRECVRYVRCLTRYPLPRMCFAVSERQVRVISASLTAHPHQSSSAVPDDNRIRGAPVPGLMDPRTFLGISFARQGCGKPFAAISCMRARIRRARSGSTAIRRPLISKLLRFPSAHGRRKKRFVRVSR